MAKKQAKRSNSRSNGTPSWLWGLMGIGLGLVIAAYFFMGDFFKARHDDQPTPNAAAEAPASNNRDEPVAQEPVEKPKPKYDFYELLPGKEVLIPDADLEAQAEAEARAAAALNSRMADQARANANKPNEEKPIAAQQAAQQPASPVSNAPAKTSPDISTANTNNVQQKPTVSEPVAVASNEARFLIQAGAFRNPQEAENLKATIAMAGEVARIESAEINGTTVYRVRLGPYGTASSLSAAKQALSSHGIEGQAIKVK
jgi:cell division protein FtsN